MKIHGRSGDIALPFSISALGGGERSVSRSFRFTAGGIGTGTDWLGGWVGPRGSLNATEKRKLLTLPGILTPHVQPVVCRYIQ
jgi:hypothetical protein